MSDALAFLDGGGEAARMIRVRDWSGHPLGSPDGWAPELRAALSLILNSPESMILAWGPDLHFFFNDTYFPLLGPRLPWAMGERFDKVWADAWAQAKPIIEDAFAGRSRRFEDLPWKLGTDRGTADTWWTFSYSRVLDWGGRVAGLFIFTNETTARVLGDAALRESEEQLRLVIEGAKDHAILTTDPLGTIRSWSAGAQATFEWSAEEAIGQAASLIFTPEDRAAGIDAQELMTAAREGIANDERWHITKSGRRVFMNGSVHVLPRDAQDRERGFIKIARDETQRRQIEEASRKNEAQLTHRNATLEQEVVGRTDERDSLWALSPDMMLHCTFAGVMTAVNVAWTDVLGWSERELLGSNLFDLIHPDDLASTTEAAKDLSEGRSRTHFENRYRCRDGSYRWIAWSTRPSASGIYASGRDFTAEKEQGQALAKAEEALRQSQKMEAVGQLTGGLAHDFNNLLAGISGSLEMMNTRITQGRLREIDKYMVAAQGAAKRAAALTHRLLAFSRQQTLAPKATNVNALVRGMLDLVQRTVGPSVSVEFVGMAGLWTTLVDGSQLENALLNLCINARDAMPNGGRITIETGNRWVDREVSWQHDVPEGQYLSLCVSDTGTGMPPDVIAKAFDPFFTTKPIGQGTGLGLSMIYGFAKQSGGQVRIYSEVGEGTMVCIYLPRHRGKAEMDQPAPDAAIVPFAEAGETVLIVDDEPTVRMLVTDVLEDLGYTAIEASDSAGGLRVLQSDARIDLLVTDVGLPGGMNGRQMADAARASRSNLKVLFITGFAENALLNNGQLEPGMSVLTKPFAVDVLAARIREIIKA